MTLDSPLAGPKADRREKREVKTKGNDGIKEKAETLKGSGKKDV
jgi:hypothetical protein